MGRGKRGRVLASLFIQFALLINLVPAKGLGMDAGDAFYCRNTIAETGDPSIARTELTRAAQDLVGEVQKDCPNPNVCSPASLQRAVAKAIAKSPFQYRDSFKKILRLPRRALVLIMWGASILGPGILSYYVSAGLPEGLRYSVTSFVMVMGGVLFGRASGPIEKRLGPKVETFAFWLWDPHEADGWGQIMKNLPETDRLKFSMIYNQVITLEPVLKMAGEALQSGRAEAAARHYVDAVLTSMDMFAGLNLDHPTTIRTARRYFSDGVANRRMADEVLALIPKVFAETPDDELTPKVIESREQALAYIMERTRHWLSVIE